MKFSQNQTIRLIILFLFGFQCQLSWGDLPGSFAAIRKSQSDYYERFNRAYFLTPVERRAKNVKIEGLPLALSESSLQKIAMNMFKNEAGCKIKALNEWDRTEPFPSIGIPHTIWYPKKDRRKYVESFPAMWKFLRQKFRESPQDSSIEMPRWLDANNVGPAPWASKAEFDADVERVGALTKFLSHPKVVMWQAEFMLARLNNSLAKIVAAAELQTPTRAQAIKSNLTLLLKSDNGILALVDYVNFKGEGVDPNERSGPENISWGLRQVLEGMNHSRVYLQGTRPELRAKDEVEIAPLIFANSAKLTLANLVASKPRKSPEHITNKYYRGGWLARIRETYENSGSQLPKACLLFPASETAASPVTTPINTPSAPTGSSLAAPAILFNSSEGRR